MTRAFITNGSVSCRIGDAAGQTLLTQQREVRQQLQTQSGQTVSHEARAIAALSTSRKDQP